MKIISGLRKMDPILIVIMWCSQQPSLVLLQQHCGIGIEDAYVFGDSSNDLSMFRYAENCVVMGDHSPVLELYATFITKTVEDDGIAYAMKELGII